MTFWILLAVMSLVAVGFAVWPMYKHEHGLTPLIGMAIIFVVGLSTGLYYRQGNPDLPSAEPSGVATADPAELAGMEEAIAGLAARLEQNPNDIEGWKMLARSYLSVQNYGDAAAAFERVLVLDPNDPESLFYGGLAAAERGDTELAANRWERLLETDPPADIQETIKRGIAEWRGEAAPMPADHPPVAEETAPEPASEPVASEPAPAVAASPMSEGAVVRAMVSLSDAARSAIGGNATVFIIARDVNVPVPPIAVSRRTTSQLPASVELGDRESMVEGRALSGFAEFELLARVSLSGGPSAKPGDWYGTIVVKPAENNDVELVIDQIVQ